MNLNAAQEVGAKRGDFPFGPCPVHWKDWMAILVFLGAALFLLYVLAGYPVPLDLLVCARGSRGVIAKKFTPRTVTVLLPVRNGGAWLRSKLESILALDYARELVEILVISDGSTDETESIAAEFASQDVRLISISRGGKAAALNAGLRHATGEILFFTDVRQELSRSALKELVACFADPAVGVASGELIILEGANREETDVGLYWQYEKWIRRRLSRLDSVLGATGCIYAMRRGLATELPEDTLLDDVFLPLAAFFKGYRVVFEERAQAFDIAMSLQTEFRRKVRTLAGVYQVMQQYPGLLGPGNRMWLHFVSHKLGRLLLPFALIALLVSSFWLPAGWREVALGIQTVGYGLALIDPLIPEGWVVKRVSSAARTFVVLMMATLVAVSFFFVPGEEFLERDETGASRKLAGVVHFVVGA